MLVISGSKLEEFERNLREAQEHLQNKPVKIEEARTLVRSSSRMALIAGDKKRWSICMKALRHIAKIEEEPDGTCHA